MTSNNRTSRRRSVGPPHVSFRRGDDDESVMSELSTASFSSTKLGRMLAEKGMHPDQDVPVNVNEKNYVSSQRIDPASSVHSGSSRQSFAESKIGKLLAEQGLQTNEEQQRQQQKVRVTGSNGEDLANHLGRHSSSQPSSTLVTQDCKSIHSDSTSSVSFSETTLAKMLAKQGVHAKHDFEVLVKSTMDPQRQSAKRRSSSHRSRNQIAFQPTSRMNKSTTMKPSPKLASERHVMHTLDESSPTSSRKDDLNVTAETVMSQESSSNKLGSPLTILDPMYEEELDEHEKKKNGTHDLNSLAKVLFATRQAESTHSYAEKPRENDFHHGNGLHDDSFYDNALHFAIEESFELPHVVSPMEKLAWRAALDQEHGEYGCDDGGSDGAEEVFHDEEAKLPFDGDALCLSAWQAEPVQTNPGVKDVYMREFGSYVDNPTASPNTTAKAYRDTDASCRSTRSVAWQPEDDEDPYRDNLQPCDIQQLASSTKQLQPSRKLRYILWGIAITAMIVLLILLLPTPSREDPKAPDPLFPAPRAPTLTPTTAPTVYEPETIAIAKPTAMDDRFYHDWSLATFETPIETYHLHPWYQDGKEFNVTVRAPAGLGYTLTAPPPVSFVTVEAHLPWSLGQGGCGDLRPLAVVPAGSQTKISLKRDRSTQVLACMEDRIVAISNHIVVKSWQDEEETYSMQILDMRTPGSDRVIHLESGELSGVDRVYLFLIGTHHRFIWLPLAKSVATFNESISKHPNRREACHNGQNLHWHRVAPANKHDLDHFLVWDFTHQNTDFATIVTLCKEEEQVLEMPVGQVFFRQQTPVPSFAPTTSMPSMAPIVWITENTTKRDDDWNKTTLSPVP